MQDTMQGPQPTRVWSVDTRYRHRFESVTETSALAPGGGTYLSVAWSGSGSPLVFVPGELAGRRIWDPQVAERSLPSTIGWCATTCGAGDGPRARSAPAATTKIGRWTRSISWAVRTCPAGMVIGQW